MCIYIMPLLKTPKTSKVLREDSRTYLSRERYHVMLAQREDLNILNNDKLIVIFVEDSSINQITDVLFIAFSKVKHGFCIALRRPSKTLSVWIFPYTFQDGRYGSFQSV